MASVENGGLPNFDLGEAVRANPERFLWGTFKIGNLMDNDASQQIFSVDHLTFGHFSVAAFNQETSLNPGLLIAVVSQMIGKDNKLSDVDELPVWIKLMEECFRKNQELSIAVFDMDDLSHVNSKYTHLHGSLVCSVLSTYLSELGRAYNGLYSGMGEENLIVLPLGVEEFTQHIYAVSQHFCSTPFDFGEGVFFQKVTVGIASLKNSNPADFKTLYTLAGGALVYGKRSGKGRVTVFANRTHD